MYLPPNKMIYADFENFVIYKLCRFQHTHIYMYLYNIRTPKASLYHNKRRWLYIVKLISIYL